MDKKLPRLQNVTLVLSAAMMTVCLPRVYAQTPAPQNQQAANQSQDRQAAPGDDITRRDLARFDQFLDTHRETAEQLRKTPSLIDDPQFLQNHAQLNTYLQDHPGVKQEISQQPGTFMRLEDSYARDRSLRDRDASGATGQDRDTLASNRDADSRDRDADTRDRDADHRDAASFDRFLDSHREIAEQVRRDPSLLDNRNFVQTHPALQTYLQDNPGVRGQIAQNPNAFMHQEDAYNRDANMRDRDPMQDHMADFGGFLDRHAEIQRDLSRDPSVVKDHNYVQNHAELDAYLNAHPDVREELMANPQNFVQGARQYNTSSPGGSGTGVNARGTSTTGTSAMTGTSSATGTSTRPAATTTPHQPQ